MDLVSEKVREIKKECGIVTSVLVNALDDLSKEGVLSDSELSGKVVSLVADF
jgi:GTP-sensing pleiotropic transcriptional regulator CodY